MTMTNAVQRRRSNAGTLGVAVAVVAAALASSAAMAETTPSVSDYDWSVTYTVGEKMGLGDKTLEGFPILLRLGPGVDGYDGGKFKTADGSDLIVVDANDGRLPYEVETWNPVGTTLIWVKVPTLATGTKVKVCYGGPAVTDNDPTVVWSSYVGVWHLDETGSPVADATGRGHGGKCAEGTSAVADGAIGGAWRISDGTTKGGIVLQNTSSVSLGKYFSVSAWLKHDDEQPGEDIIFCRKGAYKEWGGWSAHLTGNTWSKVALRSQQTDDGTAAKLSHGLEGGTWQHVVFNWGNSSNGRPYERWNYLNGVRKETSDGAWWEAADDDGRTLSLGTDTNGSGPSWRGLMDEVRIRKGMVSDTWARAEYASMGIADAVTAGPATEADHSQPYLDEAFAVIGDSQGKLTVTATLASGCGEVYALLDDGLEVPISDGEVSAPWTASVVLTGLAANTAYACRIAARNAKGLTTQTQASQVIYNGTVSVVASADAYEGGLREGRFTVSRAAAATATRYALCVPLTDVHWSAGAAYQPLPSSVTFDVGVASVTIPVVPLASSAVDEDVCLTLGQGAGGTVATLTSETLTVWNERSGVVSSQNRSRRYRVAGYSGTSTLTDFPVLVRLSEEPGGFSYADMKCSDGGDMVFVDDAGNRLPHEIQTWNPQGTSLVWVKVPSLTADAGFKMCWSGLAAADNDPSAVWSAYVGVWHLDETGATVADATAYGHDGSCAAGTSPVADGIVGGARRISDGTTKGGIVLNGTRDFAFKVADNKKWAYLTMSAWTLRDDAEPGNDIVFCRKSTTGAWEGWSAYLDSSAWGKVAMNMAILNDGQTVKIDHGLTGGEWHHVAMVWGSDVEGDRARRWVLTDGKSKSSSWGAGWETAEWNGDYENKGPNITLGTDGNGTGTSWRGLMDEVRVRRGFGGENWIAAEYASMADPGFLEAGSVEVPEKSGVAIGKVTGSSRGGALGVAVTAVSGKGTLTVTFFRADGTTDVAYATFDASADWDQVFVGAPVIPAGEQVAYAVRADGDDGTHTSIAGSDLLVSSPVTVEWACDGQEKALRPVRFLVKLGGEPLAGDLMVKYRLGGSAQAGVDYEKVSGVLTIPAGETSAFLELVPIDNGASGNRSVTVELLAGGYLVAEPSTARARIIDVAAADAWSRHLILSVRGWDGDDITDFPALVRLREDGKNGFAYAAMAYPETGDDLYFSDANGHPLPAEIDSWNRGGESTVWVKLPKLAKAVSIYAHFGGPDATALRSAADVWSDYAGVWHLDEIGNALFDSAGNGLDGTSKSATMADGLIGRARRISANGKGEKDGHAIVIPGASAALDVGSSFAFSTWIRYPEAQTPGYDRIAGRKSTYAAEKGWECRLVENSSTDGHARSGGSSYGTGKLFDNVTDGAWHFVTVVYDGTSLNTYENGIARFSGTITPVEDNDVDLCLGNSGKADEVSFKGWMDESRLRKGAVSAARVAADYATVVRDLFVVRPSGQGLMLIVR